MTALLMTLHIVACVLLIVVVLLQHGKGADMGAVLGGGSSNTVFGSRGAGNFLTKLTTGCAVTFMVTSLSLSYLGTRAADSELFDGAEVEQQLAPTPDAVTDEDVGLEEIESGDLEEIPIEGPE